MDAKNTVLDDSRKTEVVENFCAVSPDVYRAILSKALIIETIHLSNLAAFVVTTDEGNPIRVTNLENY